MSSSGPSFRCQLLPRCAAALCCSLDTGHSLFPPVSPHTRCQCWSQYHTGCPVMQQTKLQHTVILHLLSSPQVICPKLDKHSDLTPPRTQFYFCIDIQSGSSRTLFTQIVSFLSFVSVKLHYYSSHVSFSKWNRALNGDLTDKEKGRHERKS